jgi:hypothetical protein
MDDVDDKTYISNFYALDSDTKLLSYELVLHLGRGIGINIEETREQLQLLRDRCRDILPLHIIEKYNMQWRYDKLTTFLTELDTHLEDPIMVRKLHENYRFSRGPPRPVTRSGFCNLL